LERGRKSLLEKGLLPMGVVKAPLCNYALLSYSSLTHLCFPPVDGQTVGTECEGGALAEAAMLRRSMKREPGIIPSEVELNKSPGPISWRINNTLI
jgi:hypothetical protein